MQFNVVENTEYNLVFFENFVKVMSLSLSVPLSLSNCSTNSHNSTTAVLTFCF